jgi:hypothetical protein
MGTPIERRRSEMMLKWIYGVNGVPTEIRTLVTALKRQCPRPLDDGDA